MCWSQPPAEPPAEPATPLPVWQAVALGLLEGLTEYLPVSSTGHLYCAERLMGIGDGDGQRAAADAYAIAIQLGAIVAVLWVCWPRVRLAALGVAGRSPEGRRLAANVLLAFLPAAIVGLLAEDLIKRHLFGAWPIVAAWFVGGVAILLFPHRPDTEESDRLPLEDLGPKDALLIGLAQVTAMWPGVSRSLATILAGRAVRLTNAAAVEFSFLVGLITLGAATTWEILSDGATMVHAFGAAPLLIGLLAAFVSAAISVKWLLSHVTRHGLALFGYYRIALALAAGVWLVIARG
jgi:undecaprenyl-diphosphatase